MLNLIIIGYGQFYGSILLFMFGFAVGFLLMGLFLEFYE